MSQNDDSENDFVDYKPPRKKKKSRETSPASTSVTKRRCTFKKTSKREPPVSVKSPDCTKETADSGGSHSTNDLSSLEEPNLPSKSSQHADNNAEVSFSGDYCPMCQMPFSILVVQSQRWHVSECLDTPRDTCKECPEGLQCSSTIPNHYQKFNHTLLAHSRANCDPVLLSLSQQVTSGKTSISCTAQLINNEEGGFILESSQDSISGLSAISSCSASAKNNPTETPPSKLTNGLMFLRSPGPEDFKKKKGWLSSSKSQKTLSSSQESKTDVSSTPVMEESKRQPSENLPINEPFPNDDFISYSPLSEFPAETEVNNSECRKVLFTSDANSDENEEEDSLLLYSDRFSSEDEALTEFIDNFENSNDQVKERASLNTQLEMVRSVPPTNQVDVSSLAQKKSDSSSGKDTHSSSTSGITTQSNIQSPQSIVLERLRETLLKSDSLHLQNLNGNSVHSEQFQSTSLPVPLSQNSQTMPPQKLQSKAGQVSSLKQMDIGVFFGLKPHQERQKEAESGPNELDSTSVPALGENSRVRRPRRERQRKSRTDTTADTSEGLVNESGGNVADAQGEAGKGRSRGWRGRRWNRVNADGEVELPRCPFYKKIPGTKFVVDAFRYGEIEGITAYFLTHFHSDHYGGLTKQSTFPIYCNRITGNLVKSKLKVAEQYIHILPMNTQVTVEGITVTLLDANHCPGAAMLLFFLPDGQTVLHTGDFRADPSMETYPELLSCRVQTLYLDTTYCSPEYTFPRQQEAINFAASTAFELVTLHPRTLVVCGSYSVGKEKVFLALAEVLGSKVCLSRDKYNTMCCLESEQVKQRITTDWKAARVHVLPMMQLSFNKLQSHLSRFTQQYDRMVAFKPTGWTFSQQLQSVEDIEPQTSGNISIYGIPYSEHSSFLEMKRFVQWLQPLKIIPTVNNGSWASRKAMEKCFSDWNAEVKAKR